MEVTPEGQRLNACAEMLGQIGSAKLGHVNDVVSRRASWGWSCVRVPSITTQRYRRINN